VTLINPRHRFTLTSGLQKTADHIESLQLPSGAIPWVDKGVIDPWNHIEAMMGLAVANRLSAVERALEFLAETQLPDGSWWGEYGNAVPMQDHTHLARTEAPKLRDTNFCAYVATGVWHYYLVEDDIDILRHHWDMVRNAINFVLSHQSEHGEIKWCADATGKSADDALVSGCSSIFKSLDCAILIGKELDRNTQNWQQAKQRLGRALRHKPDRFDRSWQKKDRFSMDWYYPVLANTLPRQAAKRRLAKHWSRYVEDGLGCRCVSDQPWVTVAESCELAIALIISGERDKALELFKWQARWRDGDGAYWMGYQYKEDIFWPEEKPSWTSAAVLLAADALHELSQASRLFVRALGQDRTPSFAAKQVPGGRTVAAALTQPLENS